MTPTHLFAYAQMLSTRGQVFRAASTLPRETYSPACSFTKSFLRSRNLTIKKYSFYTMLCYKSSIDLWTNNSFMNVHTHYLQTAIRVKLSDISGAEPPLTLVILEKVVIVPVVFKVTHGHIGSAYKNLSSRVWRIFCGVPTWEFRRRIFMQKPIKSTSCCSFNAPACFWSYPRPSPWGGSHSKPEELQRDPCWCLQLCEDTSLVISFEEKNPFSLSLCIHLAMNVWLRTYMD